MFLRDQIALAIKSIKEELLEEYIFEICER